MSKKTTLIASALILGAACARDVTGPVAANPVRGVVMTLLYPGACLEGGCDPPGAGRTHLALLTIVNTGSATAYLSACGDYAAIAEQQFVDGQWVNVGPAITCPVTLGPVVLVPGDSLRQNWFFATGRRRLVLGVAGTANLSDEALDTSGSVDIP